MRLSRSYDAIMSHLTQEELKKRLAKYGLKSTLARRDLVASIENSDRPVSAEELAIRMAQQKLAHRATVYRELAALVKAGLVTELAIRGIAGKFYESGKLTNKPHFVCEECKQIVALDGGIVLDEVDEYTKQLANKGKKVNAWSFKLYGLCEMCVKEERNVN